MSREHYKPITEVTIPLRAHTLPGASATPTSGPVKPRGFFFLNGRRAVAKLILLLFFGRVACLGAHPSRRRAGSGNARELGMTWPLRACAGGEAA